MNEVRWLSHYVGVMDEARCWSGILARALGHYDERRLIGFRRLGKRSKVKCSICGKKAEIAMIFSRRPIELYYWDVLLSKPPIYTVYYCKKCFKEILEKTKQEITDDLNRLVSQIFEDLLESDSQ